MRLQYSIPQGTRALIDSRFSTDEQRQQSIDDQNDDCLTFLTEEDSKCLKSVEYLKGERLSGELRHRPGINLVRRRILQKGVDLIVCEDSSRLFRHGGMCDELVSMAVDIGIRVICINDRVDTLMEDWQQRLEDAQRHHRQDNYYTRFRIKRAHKGLWKMEAAIGPRLPGYRCVIRNPELKKPPKFDELIEEWAPVILGAFERVAREEPLWQVAEFLTNAGLPRPAAEQMGPAVTVLVVYVGGGVPGCVRPVLASGSVAG